MADRLHLSRIRSCPGGTCHRLPPPSWCSTGTLCRCCQGSVQRLPVKGQVWLSQVYKKQPFSPLLSCCTVQTESLVDLLIIQGESETRINKFYFSLCHLCFFLPSFPISLSSLLLFFPHIFFLILLLPIFICHGISLLYPRQPDYLLLLPFPLFSVL